MPHFEITGKKILEFSVEIEADTAEEAEAKALKMDIDDFEINSEEIEIDTTKELEE